MDNKIVSTVWSVVKKYNIFENETIDDLYGEAIVAACVAISKYQANKGAKLETFIYSCVENYFKDKIKNVKADKRTGEVISIEEDWDEPISDARVKELEHEILMEEILTAKELFVYKKLFVEDCTITELFSNPLPRREVREIYKSILSKYKMTLNYQVAVC